MKVGQAVKVEVYGGRIVSRIVSKIIDNKIVVVSEKDWLDSLEDGFLTMGVGYDYEKVYAISE